MQIFRKTNLTLHLVNKQTLIASISLFAFSFIGYGQTDVNKDVDPTRVYEQVVKEGYGTPSVYKALGDGHYFKGNFTEAKIWYEKLFETEPTSDATIMFRYKQSLKALNINFTTNEYLNPVIATESSEDN